MATYEELRSRSERLIKELPENADYVHQLIWSHNALGNLQYDANNLEEATRWYGMNLAMIAQLPAVQLQSPMIANQLGFSFHYLAMVDTRNGQLEEARTKLLRGLEIKRRALAIYPRDAELRFGVKMLLGNLLAVVRQQNRPDEVTRVEAEIEAIDLGPDDEAIDARLVAVRGGQPVANPAEWLPLGDGAFRKKWFALSARLLAEAAVHDPKLDHRQRSRAQVGASFAAVLAADGKAGDEPSPDATVRAGFRARALAWLRGELDRWDALFVTGTLDDQQWINSYLEFWKRTPNLASVRDGLEPGQLPEAERLAWRDFWAEVDRQLIRSRKLKEPAAK